MTNMKLFFFLSCFNHLQQTYDWADAAISSVEISVLTNKSHRLNPAFIAAASARPMSSAAQPTSPGALRCVSKKLFKK